MQVKPVEVAAADGEPVTKKSKKKKKKAETDVAADEAVVSLIPQ